MNQHGLTFLEVIVVIAILMIVTSMVSPGIGDWRQRRALESDFHVVLAQIDYLKTRARVLNGTAVLSCTNSNSFSALTYQIFDKKQANVLSVPDAQIEKSLEGPSRNLLSTKTRVLSPASSAPDCGLLPGIFISSGQSGLANGAAIDLIIEPISGVEKFGSYEILINQTTGFIQKFKCFGGCNKSRVEIE